MAPQCLFKIFGFGRWGGDGGGRGGEGGGSLGFNQINTFPENESVCRSMECCLYTVKKTILNFSKNLNILRAIFNKTFKSGTTRRGEFKILFIGTVSRDLFIPVFQDFKLLFICLSIGLHS